MEIVVATDLHYLSSSLTDNGSFFTEMVDNADSKNMYYIEEITEAFTEKIIDEKPEILILSGDLTFNGEKQSHLDLEEKLSRIQKNGTQILTMSGNHDVDRSSAAGFYGDSYQLVDSVSKDEFAEIYQDYGLQQALQRDEHSLSYVYKARSDFWILMLDSNADKVNYISNETYTWLENVLKEAQADNIQLLAVSHQNILAHNPYFRDGFVISQAARLEMLYEKYDVMANLSGHIHIQHIESSDLPEILTSALPVSPHHYGRISFDGKALNYQVECLKVEDWAKEQGLTDKKLENFTDFTHQFMEEVAWRKMEQDLLDTKLTESERNSLLGSFAKLNADYFAGNKVAEEDYAADLNFWKNQGSTFYYQYMKTILESAKKDHHSLHLIFE